MKNKSWLGFRTRHGKLFRPFFRWNSKTAYLDLDNKNWTCTVFGLLLYHNIYPAKQNLLHKYNCHLKPGRTQDLKCRHFLRPVKVSSLVLLYRNTYFSNSKRSSLLAFWFSVTLPNKVQICQGTDYFAPASRPPN